MWSRLNAVGMRRRWATREDDPGRLGWPAGQVGQPAADAVRTPIADVVRREFLAGAAIINCPTPGCVGILVTGQREFANGGQAGSRVLFRCTREADDHEFTISLVPFTSEESDRLHSSLRGGASLTCPRCETKLDRRSSIVGDGPADPAVAPESFGCSWCGLSWSPSSKQLNADRSRHSGSLL